MGRYQAQPAGHGFVVRDTYTGSTVTYLYRTMGWAARRADQLNEEAFQAALARAVYTPESPPGVEPD